MPTKAPPELVMGTKGTLYLTSNKGLFYREKLADDVGWSAKRTADGGSADASVVTSGKTLKLSNSPWAHRGEPLEIDNCSATIRATKWFRSSIMFAAKTYRRSATPAKGCVIPRPSLRRIERLTNKHRLRFRASRREIASVWFLSSRALRVAAHFEHAGVLVAVRGRDTSSVAWKHRAAGNLWRTRRWWLRSPWRGSSLCLPRRSRRVRSRARFPAAEPG